MSGARVDGTWRTPSLIYARESGSWKIVAQTFAKESGTWKATTFGSPPPKPTLTYVSTGVFQLTNYNPILVYTVTLVSGSGTATFNATNQRYTLSGANSAFNVVARYAAGAPASVAGYMERRAYTYSCRTVPQTCFQSCNCRLEGGNCGCAAPVNGSCDGVGSPNGQCGCGGGTPCMFGSIGQVVCDSCPYDCSYTVCDVLINQPGYTNSGTEWYKVS